MCVESTVTSTTTDRIESWHRLRHANNLNNDDDDDDDDDNNNNNNNNNSGLSRSDGKRPDGLSLIPWQEGKPLCWDVTVICPLANSYLQSATASAGAVAELAATPKVAKYQNTAHWKTSTCSSPLLWSLLVP